MTMKGALRALLLAAALREGQCAEPKVFEVNARAGGGGAQFKDSARFRIYNVTGAPADAALNLLESAYECVVETMGWRSSGLSFNDKSDKGPYYKMNAYAVPSAASIGGAAGVMGSDARTGAAFVKVVTGSITNPIVTVHEYGHALTYYERNWVEQGQTGTYWETVAQFVADTYMTAPFCEKARSKYGQKEGRTIIELGKVLGSSYQVIVDGTRGSGNQYQAWPIFSYITYNPDKYPSLGFTAMRDMFRKYKIGSNETPLHALQRVAAPTPVQTVIGRYWARMAYVDIGHKQAKEQFSRIKGRINYGNVDSKGNGVYQVKEARAPRYMGASIIPLKGNGKVTVKVTAQGEFTATAAIKSGSAVKYVDLTDGSGSFDVASGEEASLVVANTPKTLLSYDAFRIPPAVNKGLVFQVQLTGATA